MSTVRLEYDLVYHYEHRAFVAEIDAVLAAGWRLHGPTFWVDSRGGFHQAVVRELPPIASFEESHEPAT